MQVFSGFLPQVIQGVWITIEVACASLILGLVFGLLGAAGESAPISWIRYISTAIISIIRGVPELLVLFFIYFGGAIILNSIMGRYVDFSPFLAGVIGLSLIFGSYASQIFRGAFLAVPYGQIEAGKALALNRWQIFHRIKLPQALRHALPGLGNIWLVLLKDTALVSLLGLADLMNKSQLAASTTHKPFTFFSNCCIYLLNNDFNLPVWIKKTNE